MSKGRRGSGSLDFNEKEAFRKAASFPISDKIYATKKLQQFFEVFNVLFHRLELHPFFNLVES